MSNTANPHEPAIEEVSSSSTQADPKKNDGEPGTGVGTPVYVPPAPKYQGNTTENERKPRKPWKVILKYVPHVLSALALGVSFSSQNASWEAAGNSGRSADAAEESAGNSKRSADAAEKSATAAQRNADTAERALKTTIENFQMDQRARVGVRGIQLPSGVREGAKWAFKADGINTGKTSALNVKSIIATRGMLKDTPFTAAYSEKILTSIDRSVGTVVAGAPIYPMTKEVVPTKVQSDAFSQGLMALYVYGEISYDDRFDHPHCTIYCYYFISDFSSPIACGTYNHETDTKCDNIK